MGLVAYKGLTVLDSAVGDGGDAISDNFRTLADHADNTSNPHSVTAEQVGAYSTGEVDTALAAKASTTDLTDHATATTTAHGGIVASNDSRLTDARNPTPHKATHSTGQADALAPADIGAEVSGAAAAVASDLTTHTTATTTAHGGIVADTDSRLTDARTPTPHKATHSTGQSDALAPTDIGAATSGHTHEGMVVEGTPTNDVILIGIGGQVRSATAIGTPAHSVGIYGGDSNVTGGSVTIGSGGGIGTATPGNLTLQTQQNANGDKGRLFIINLPTSDPLVANQIWHDTTTHTLKISVGA